MNCPRRGASAATNITDLPTDPSATHHQQVNWLTQSTVNFTLVKTPAPQLQRYNAIGNLTAMSDVGSAVK